MEVRWDPRNLGKVLVYTEEGFLSEAFNLELASLHPSLEQLREYKRMKKLQREVALAHLELMHLAADGLTALDLVKQGRRRHSVRSQRAELAPRAGSNGSGPIFTSQAAREAWEAEQRQPGGDGYGHS